jgi:hypothetical protein
MTRLILVLAFEESDSFWVLFEKKNIGKANMVRLLSEC